MAREFLLLVDESSYKTTATPTVGTNAFYVRLDGSNAFTPRGERVDVKVPFGGGVATRRFTVSDKFTYAGRLVTKLYASPLTEFLLGKCADASGGDLGSFTTYHAIERDDGTLVRAGVLGCKAAAWTLEISEDSTIGTLSMDIVGSEPISPAPDATAFPMHTDAQLDHNPYVYINTSLTVGSARSNFSGVRISSRNTLARRFWANSYVQLLKFLSRETTVEVDHFYMATPDDRAAYEAMTSKEVVFTLDNGTYSMEIDFNANNLFDAVADQLDLNDIYMQKLTLGNQWEDGVGDLAVSFTGP